ncbi:MAG: sensor histidine kinase [Bacteroidota bacterium]
MRFTLVLLLFSLHSFAQQSLPCTCTTYDSLFAAYRKAKDAADASLTEKISVALTKNQAPFCRAMGLNLLANVRINASQMKEGSALIEIQKKLLDSLRCGRDSYLEYFLTKSFYHYLLDEYDSSIANSIKALDIAERTGVITRQITLRLGIGSAFYRIGQPEKKMEYARSIIPLIEQVNDESFQCQYYFNLFGAYYTYYQQKQLTSLLDSADYFNKKSLRIARRTNNRRFLPYCYEGLEMVNREKNGSPRAGITYLDSALYFGKNSLNNAQLSELLINKASLLGKLGRKKEAMTLADSGLYYSAQHPQKSVYASHLLDASELYSELGEYKRALSLYHQGDLISDSIKSVENARTVRELEEKYNKERNEKKISELSRESEVRTLQIRLLIVGVIGALIAIVLIVFIYRLSLLRQRQLAVDSKYRLNQALINPHFISNALVSIQRFMLENNGTQAAQYLTKFSKLMRQLLVHSREERITVEEELELLENYLVMQKLRLKDTLNYQINIDKQASVAECFIPPMFVQPFVENAVEHGASKVAQGMVVVSVSRKGNQVQFVVEDNGPGISGEEKKEHTSVATSLIRERIALVNKSAKVPIELIMGAPLSGQGTRIELRLPIYS